MGHFERALLATFAYQQARYTGSLDCMKAICYVMRNRIQAGWGDGTFLSVMNGHAMSEGNEGSEGWAFNLESDDRLLQMIVRDIDDIYLGTAADDARKAVADALYYHFVDKPSREWFIEKIVHDPASHPMIAQIGPAMFFR